MKQKIVGLTFIFLLLSNTLNADLLNSLIWAGTKAVVNSEVRKAQNYSKHKTKTKKSKRTRSKSRTKTVVYRCTAKALRASGWRESTNLAKAKKGAIRQCMIRRVSNKPCIIQNCYKK